MNAIDFTSNITGFKTLVYSSDCKSLTAPEDNSQNDLLFC